MEKQEISAIKKEIKNHFEKIDSYFSKASKYIENGSKADAFDELAPIQGLVNMEGPNSKGTILVKHASLIGKDSEVYKKLLEEEKKLQIEIKKITV